MLDPTTTVRQRQREQHRERARRHRRRERDGRGDARPLVAPSFDPIVLDRLRGYRDALRGNTGRCNLVRGLASYFGLRFPGVSTRATSVSPCSSASASNSRRLGLFLIAGLNCTDWRVIQVVEVENYYLAIDNDDAILRQDRLNREDFASREGITLAIRVLVVVVGALCRQQWQVE